MFKLGDTVLFASDKGRVNYVIAANSNVVEYSNTILSQIQFKKVYKKHQKTFHEIVSTQETLTAKQNLSNVSHFANKSTRRL